MSMSSELHYLHAQLQHPSVVPNKLTTIFPCLADIVVIRSNPIYDYSAECLFYGEPVRIRVYNLVATWNRLFEPLEEACCLIYCAFKYSLSHA